MRIACVVLTNFAVRLERRDRPELRRLPLVIGGAPGERRAVFDCSPEAARAGVRPGMALRQALAHCRDAVFIDPRPALYAETFTAILTALGRFSPRIQPVEPGCVLLDLNGTDRLWPDEHDLGRDLIEAVRAVCRLTPAIGIADGVFAARAAAHAAAAVQREPAPRGRPDPLASAATIVERRINGGDQRPAPVASVSASRHPVPTSSTGSAGRQPPALSVASIATATGIPPATIIPPGHTPAFLAPLPVGLLPVSAEMQRRLRLLGIRTLGELAVLPAGAVQAQFGREGMGAWRLAGGVDHTALVAHTVEEAPEERLDFPAPTADRGALTRAAELLLQRLFRRAETGNRLARRLALQIMLEDGRAWERMITFHDATADVAVALFAVRVRLEALELPAAATALTLTLHDLCGERGRQQSLFSAKSRHLAQLEEEILRLRAGLGIAPVLRVVEVEPWSRLPERQRALTEYQP